MTLPLTGDVTTTFTDPFPTLDTLVVVVVVAEPHPTTVDAAAATHPTTTMRFLASPPNITARKVTRSRKIGIVPNYARMAAAGSCHSRETNPLMFGGRQSTRTAMWSGLAFSVQVERLQLGRAYRIARLQDRYGV
jgi:hypothetical protein